MMKYNIQCSKCCSTALTTKPHFDKNHVTGDMVELLPDFKELTFAGLKCPLCGWPICDSSGLVKRLEPASEEDENTVAEDITYDTVSLAETAGVPVTFIKMHRKDIPGEKTGRSYVYTQEAVEAVKKMSE